MIDLILEILVYLAVAALLGLLLGYLLWGWGQRGRIAAARSEGATSARTSVDGNAALRTQLDACNEERLQLEAQIEFLQDRVVELSAKASTPAGEAHSGPAYDAHGEARDDDDVSVDWAPEPPRPVPLGGMPLRGEDGDTAETPGPSAEETFLDYIGDEAPAHPAPPETLLAARPRETDDLKRIKGIGKVMEEVLNDKGIYLFHQLANLTSSDIAWINDAIEAFPGRISRDRWVDQAQSLYLEKYGRRHDADG